MSKKFVPSMVKDQQLIKKDANKLLKALSVSLSQKGFTGQRQEKLPRNRALASARCMNTLERRKMFFTLCVMPFMMK